MMKTQDASPAGQEPAATSRRAALVSALTLVPAVLLVIAWVAWIDVDGGYFPRDWYPVAVGVIGLVALAVAAGWRLPASRLARVALALLAAFVALNFLSILWADAPGNALQTSDKLLLYLGTAVVLALVPWTAMRAGWLLAAWSVGTLVLSLLHLIDAAGAEDPTRWFIEARFVGPLGYAGGSAAVAAIAAWPALILSTSRDLPVVVRGLLLATAVVLIELAILPQSRGAVYALVITLPLLVLLAPRRWMLLLSLLVGGATLALTLGGILDVYSAARDGTGVVEALDSSLGTLAKAGAIAAVAGLLIALADRRITASERVLRPARFAVMGLGALVVLAAIVAFAVNAGSISDSLNDRWDRFKTGQDESAGEESRLISTDDPQRYDYYRVGVDMGLDRPLGGFGAGNYEPVYTARRHDEKHSRYAHDIWVRHFAETGFTGLLLFIGALACGFVALARGARRAPPGARLIAAACAVATGYFLIHASLDWVDEFAAVGAPGLGLLFVGLGTVYPAPRLVGGAERRSWVRPAAAVAGGLLLLGAVVALALPYLSLRYTERGTDRYGIDRETAREDFDRAHDLNPLAIAPELAAGSLATRAGRYGEASAAYRQALETEDNWYARFQLALLESAAGHPRAARTEIERTLDLNGRDPFVQEAAGRIRRGRQVDPNRVNAAIARETRERFAGLR